MSPPLPIIGAGEHVGSLAEHAARLDAVMVVEEGKPVGVITRYDLLGFLSDGALGSSRTGQVMYSCLPAEEEAASHDRTTSVPRSYPPPPRPGGGTYAPPPPPAGGYAPPPPGPVLRGLARRLTRRG